LFSWRFRLASLLDQLAVNPLHYASTLETPIGFFLRKIFAQSGEADTALRETLYERTTADQLTDGSWDHLFVRTANSLWNLALLGCDAKDRSVKRGLEWLLSIQRRQYQGYPGFFLSNNKQDARAMRSTFYGEFGPGCTVFYQTAYAIHLFHMFGFDNNQRVQTAIRSYLQFWTPEWCGTWCTINVLRVLMEHPLSAHSQQVEDGIKYLARRQTSRGTWKAFPFYHTFHALSRASNELARKQLEKALPLVVKRQSQNGSWGRKESETETFLVLTALRRLSNMEPTD
jgi:hypothetical protein